MKRLLVFLPAIILLSVLPASSQSKFIKKVANSVSDELLGSQGGSPKKSTSSQPEPSCACKDAELILDLGGKLNIMYSEVNIDVLDDGSILIGERASEKFYVVKDGVTKGPFSGDDPQVAIFRNTIEPDYENMDGIISVYKDYISRSGEKYLIKFDGKNYGPYASINNFMVTGSKDKFAALVVENIIATADQGEKMEEAIKNAKSEQEKMELAMKFAQEMQQRMMAGGGPSGTTPKLISNIQGLTYNQFSGGTLNAKMKYDDILINEFTGVSDLKGNKLITLKPEHSRMDKIFLNSSNTKYAAYEYGTAYFSDGSTLSDLFNPRLIKTEGKIYLAYMYYSPAKNSVMQCKTAF